MHRGSIFIITKNKDNKFEVKKSTEFNGGMGLDCHGKVIYDMLRNLKEPLLFDAMIRDFDNEYFKYCDEYMTYSLCEEKEPYIDEKGVESFEYSQTENQFKFFRDDNGEYIYTSDSNYIKNLTNEDITIVCSNGNFVLKPNQVIITDYDECINNSRTTFNQKIDEKIQIDSLDTIKYIPSRKEKIILDNIIKTLESFNYNVSLLYENGMVNCLEIETWSNSGVDMIHTFYFPNNFQDIYDKNNINKQLQEILDNFSIDDEIDLHRQDKRYKDNFTIQESLNDFTEYQSKLEDLAKNFISKYHEMVYKKFMEKDFEKEMI